MRAMWSETGVPMHPGLVTVTGPLAEGSSLPHR